MYTYEMPKAPQAGDRTEVGIRELRNHLSRYVDAARSGREVVVTERGRPVARLTGLSTSRERIEALIAAGLVTPPKKPAGKIHLDRLVRPRGSVADLVTEMRRSRPY